MQEEKSTILIVDDVKIGREMARRILQQEYIVMEAENGLQALEILGKNKGIGLILLDLVMPVMDGHTFLEKIKNTQYSSVPIVVMTAESDERQKERVLQAGAIDYIEKPFNSITLLSRVRSAIMRNQILLLEKLKFISTHDTLTGLFNRSQMFEMTKRMLEEHPDEKFIFIRYDIDRFRLYTSAMGEEEGNHLLLRVADEIRENMKIFPYTTYGRIDADIFCICEPYDEVKVKKQLKAIEHAQKNYREDYQIDATIGVYRIEDNSENVESMFKKASMATGKEKHVNNMNISYYEESMAQKLEEEKWVVSEMKHALEKKQYKVYLQPKYDITIDQPCGAEALVRWIHPDKGMISPGKFIPVFEKNGFIASLDMYMCEEVCILLKKWQQEKKKLVPISVNLSRISLYNPHIAQNLKDLVDQYHIDSSLMQLEITESAYMSNPDLMKETIAKLQQEGFVILIDDFGSGYSSLNTLKEIDVDILKIDMKFMPNGKEDSKGEKILSAIIRMAGWLEIPVIAEGVETIEQRDVLRSMGCRYVQGYFYAKPMPVSDCAELFSKSIIFDDGSKNTEGKSQISAVWSTNQQVDEIMNKISLPVMVIENSIDRNEIVRTNTAYIELFGSPQRENLYGNLNPENEAMAREAFRHSKMLHSCQECELPFFDKDGKRKWVRMKVQLINQIDKSNLYCCVFIDITQEKILEEQLEGIKQLIGTNTNKEKMLVVDDVKISRKVLQDIFGDTYDIIEARDGKEGVDALKEHAQDIVIVLLDIFMPRMDGYAFLEEKMKIADAEDIPIIVISSGGKEEIELSILKMGVNDFITKPFHKDIVKQRVENVLAYHGRVQKIIQEAKKK